MKTTIAVIAATLLATIAANATMITVDIGPPRRLVSLDIHQQFITPFASPVTSITGQTLSLDFRFNNNEFVSLYPSTSRVFDVAAVLQVFHQGPMQFVGPFQVWTVDANGNPNSPIETNTAIGTGIANGTFNYSLGGLFPVIGGPQTQFKFYGLDVRLTLPDLGYPVVGPGLFIMSPDGGNPNRNKLGIGPTVPDTGSTLAMLAGAVATLIGLRRRSA